MFKSPFLILGVFLFTVLVSCSKKELAPEVVHLGYRYYPLQEGYWIRYSVEEITIDVPIALYDTQRYELKEVYYRAAFDSSADGQQWYVEQWRRADSTLAWDKFRAASILINSRMLLRTDENLPYIKLCFPMSKNLSWNGNAYNRLTDEDYTIVSVSQNETIGVRNYDSVSCCKHHASESLFEKKYEAEKYASSVGLVWFQNIDIESQTSSTIQIDVSQPILSRITKGTIVTQTCLNWKH